MVARHLVVAPVNAGRTDATKWVPALGLVKAPICEIERIPSFFMKQRTSGTVSLQADQSAPLVDAPAVRERKLVDRCLAGDVKAWEQLYAEQHSRLQRSIRAVLRGRGADSELIEEIAARVWYAVVSKGGELLDRFDSRRGCRLNTFLSVIARAEAAKLFRSESRRRRREAIAGGLVTRSSGELAGQSFQQALSSFFATLTRREREYCLASMVQTPHNAAFSAPNASQLRRRVRMKLHQYVEANRD